MAQSNKIVKSIKGKKTDIKKANAILGWVQKNTKYDFYSGTLYGALGLLNQKKPRKANCADQAHLTVALLRAQNIPAKYRSNIRVNSKTNLVEGHTWVYAGIKDKKRKTQMEIRSTS